MTFTAYAALWLFVFSVPWENVLVIPGMAIVTRATGVLAAGLALLALVATGRARRPQPFHVWALLFVMWVGCGLLFFYSGWQVVPNKFWTYVQLLLVLWIVWEVAPDRKRLLGLLAAYVLGSYVAALDTIMIYRREAGALTRFAAGEADPNDLAMTLALALPMAWYLGMTYHRAMLRWAYRLFVPLGLLAIGLTGSRGGMVASFVALLIVPLTLPTFSAGRRALAIALIVISCVVAVTYVPETIIQRLATTGSELEVGRMGGRFKLWRAGMLAFQYRPVVGYGPGGFKRAAAPWLTQQAQVAHNSYVSLLVEQGVIGFLLYCGMIVAVLIAVVRLPPLERKFGLVLLATLLIAMMPLTWEDRKSVWLILAILLGLSSGRVPPVLTTVGRPRSIGLDARRAAAPGPAAGMATGGPSTPRDRP